MNAPLSVTRLISFLMAGAHLVGEVGSVGTVLPEGAPVTPVSASVTLALFIGFSSPEGQPRDMRWSFTLIVDSTARDVMRLSRQLPPGGPLSGEYERSGVGLTLVPHSLVVDLGTQFWFLPPMLL